MPDDRPILASPRASTMLEAVRSTGQAFDPDVWHVMDQRDNQLIAEEIMYGAGSAKFVYSFQVAGSKDPVAGISVVGARHLANHYGGIKHRLVAATQKVGRLFQFTSYPSRETEMRVSCAIIAELADEPDFFGCVVEVQDIKTGNAIQTERRENRYEMRRDGSGTFERPNYSTIAQSKAYRNAVLALIPQDIQIRWKLEMLKLNKDDLITQSVIETKRANVLRFAAGKSIPIDRRILETLTFDQIAGLSDAAHTNAAAFVASLVALGVTPAEGVPAGAAEPGPARKKVAPPKQDGPKQDGGKQAGAKEAKKDPPHDPQTGEIKEDGEHPAPPADEGEAQGQPAGKAPPKQLFGE